MGGSFFFVFEPYVLLSDAEMTLHLAMFAVEGLVGLVEVRLNADYQVDVDHRVIAIDCRSRAGWLLARIFTGLLFREFGEDAFRILRIDEPSARTEEVSA